MSALTASERAAIGALIAARGTAGRASPRVSLRRVPIGGRRLSVLVAGVAPKLAGPGARPHLRFDRGVHKLAERLKLALEAKIPAATTVAVTVTAPIWLLNRTSLAIERVADRLLRQQRVRRAFVGVIHENGVRVQVFMHRARAASKVALFVHNPETDPRVLLETSRALLAGIGGALDRHARRGPPAGRWLVLVDPKGAVPVDTYRHAFAQLFPAYRRGRVLIAQAGRRVEPLER